MGFFDTIPGMIKSFLMRGKEAKQTQADVLEEINKLLTELVKDKYYKLNMELLSHAQTLNRRLEIKKTFLEAIFKYLNDSKDLVSDLERDPKIQPFLKPLINKRIQRGMLLKKAAIIKFESAEKPFNKILNIEKEDEDKDKVTEKLLKKDKELVIDFIHILKFIGKEENKELNPLLDSVKSQFVRGKLSDLFNELIETENQDDRLVNDVSDLQVNIQNQEQSITKLIEIIKDHFKLQIKHHLGLNKTLDLRKSSELRRYLSSNYNPNMLFKKQENLIKNITYRQESKRALIGTIAKHLRELREEILASLEGKQKASTKAIYFPRVPDNLGGIEPLLEIYLDDDRVKSYATLFVKMITDAEKPSNPDMFPIKKLRRMAWQNKILENEINLSKNKIKHLIAYFSFLTYGENPSTFRTTTASIRYKFYNAPYQVPFKKIADKMRIIVENLGVKDPIVKNESTKITELAETIKTLAA